jgi:uncharacterized C2H2 Zn-finger protein
VTGARDGRVWPRCPDCGTTWRQSGNRTGHCSACHRTFTSAGAFDRHRRDSDTGRTCIDPGPAWTGTEGAGHVVYDLLVGHGAHDEGTTYWALHTTDEQRAAYAALNEDRKAAR